MLQKFSNRGWVIGCNQNQFFVLRCLISNDVVIIDDNVDDFVPIFVISVNKVTPVEMFLNRCLSNGLYLNLCDYDLNGLKVKRKSDCVYDVDDDLIKQILHSIA